MDKIKSLAEEELGQINEELCNIEEQNEVFADLKHFVCGNSKQIRSVLALLYMKTTGHKLSCDILSLLTAGEIIHNASLLHDDVIDNAELRRGKTTLAKKYSSHISVLMGDYLLSLGVKKIFNINNSKITDIMFQCTKEMANAEVRQYLLRGKTPSLEEYIEICEGKTAGLFEAILKSLAVLINEDELKAGMLGRKFGTLFQIKNDISKDSVNSDKANNIHTALDILGIEKTQDLIDNYREEIRSILNTYPENEYKQGLRDLVNKI